MSDGLGKTLFLSSKAFGRVIEMEPEIVKREISTLERVLFDADHRVIDNESRSIFQKLLAQLYNHRKGIKWQLRVSSDEPIRFVPCDKGMSYLEVDLFGSVGEAELRRKLGGQDFPSFSGSWTLRLWSKVEKHYHRPGIDCLQTKMKVKDSGTQRGRVLSRFHFDSAMEGALEPVYHFHVGGKYRDDDEFCWYPDWLKVPRFAHHPLNLILVCEFIIANFFPKEYGSISEEPTWERAVATAQEEFVYPYFESICNGKRENRSILKRLCESS